jgi:hypothetical protein
MARESGGGAAFAWTLLGFLAGVAATLGLQLLVSGPTRGERGGEVAASSAPAPKKVVVSSAAPTPTRAQPEAEVADDAAAAGMTSRTTPSEPADPDVPQDHSAPGPSN